MDSTEENKLSVELLFTESLKPNPATHFKFAPDDSCVTFLTKNAKNPNELSIWRFDLAKHTTQEWLCAPAKSSPTSESQFEKDERERKRQFTSGINDYYWHPNGSAMIVPTNGSVYSVDITTPDEPKWKVLSQENGISAVKLSPQGNFISFVRNNNLYFQAISEESGIPITQDEDPLIINGLPDFLAAEEMHRFEGHWWSDDENQIAFCRVDESPVPVSYRLEINAGAAQQVAQRYPFTGEKNPITQLILYDLKTKTSKEIWSSQISDDYLGRVLYSKHGLFIIEQNRSQNRLAIKKLNEDQTSWSTLYEESSDYWINLTNDLHVSEEGNIIYSTERTGTRKPIFIQNNGNGTPKELKAPSHLNSLVALKDNALYGMGWHEDPTENHLFRIDLEGGDWRQLTNDTGWHSCFLDTKTERVIDYFSNSEFLPKIKLRSLSDFDNEVVIREENWGKRHPYYPFRNSHSKPICGSIDSEDGTKLYYRLTPPNKITENHPIINYVYGGPGAQKVKNEWGQYLLQLFAHEGFGVLEIDNHGSSNRGIEFESKIHKKMGQQEVADQILGLNILDNHKWAAKDRVGIYGHSYGGYMTLMCLTKANRHFKSGVSVAPVCDWRLYDTHYTERYMGNPRDNDQGYEDGNVLTHLSKLKAPLLLMHGMADDNVLLTHSTMIISELQRLNKKFELMLYPGSKHSIQERHASVHRFQTILDFFHKTL